MKKIVFILALSLMSCRCSPVKETQIDCQKKVSDLSASNWILRAQKDSLNKVGKNVNDFYDYVDKFDDGTGPT